MQVFAVRTIYGELIGRVADSITDAQIETQGFIELERPLMLHTIPTPQGMMNAMVPVTQFMETDVLPVPLPHLVTFGPAHEQVAKGYLQMTSGIALPGASSKLELVKG
jgi:hypothetical protein